MKNISILMIIGIALLSGACEDHLDKPPLDSITDQELSFSITEMELYSNQYYTNLTAFTSMVFGDLSSDNMIHADFTRNSRLSGVIVVPESGGGWNWGTIRGLNYFLANYTRTKDPWESVRIYVGEIYFFKAYTYFELLRSFGDLPWFSEPLTTDSPELYDPRLPRNVVADSILANLDKAIEFLDPGNATAPGRISRDAALAFQSRVALYEGSWERYHEGTNFVPPGSDPDKYFRKAAEAAKRLIDEGSFSIHSTGEPYLDYWRLFNQESLESNPEVILWRDYNFELGITHQAQNLIIGEGANSSVSKQLVDSYLDINGMPISLSGLYQGDNTVEEAVIDRDPRLAQTIYQIGDPQKIDGADTIKYQRPFLNMPALQANTTGYQMFKGTQPEARDAGPGGPGHTTANPIFRYAEVLLNYAEAKAELGEADQAVLDMSINRLRDRVGMPHMTVAIGFVDPDWEFPTLSPLINEIRRERKVELACEGFRFDDLMRWRAHHLINRPLSGASFAQFEALTWEPPLGEISVDADGYIFPWMGTPGWQFDPSKHYLNPLPTQELTLNPNLEQNPGY